MTGREVRHIASAALILAAGGCGEAGESAVPYPTDQSRVLAVDTSGGWVNVDFLVQADPLTEARRCVESRPDAEAVTCFGFESREAYRAAQPTAAGNFEKLCWDIRWQRNKLGDVSADTLTSFQRDDACPKS